MTDNDKKVLKVLVDHYDRECNCLHFSFLSEVTDLDCKAVRRIVRRLARNGMAQFVRGLFDDEGRVAGSGYCCTLKGKIENEEYEQKSRSY